MNRPPESRAQRINGERGRMLADIGFTLEETLAPRQGRGLNVVPGRQPGKEKRRVVEDVYAENRTKGDAENRGHGDGLQQRPAQAENGTAVSRPEIHLHEREPEVATLPNGSQIRAH